MTSNGQVISTLTWSLSWGYLGNFVRLGRSVVNGGGAPRMTSELLSVGHWRSELELDGGGGGARSHWTLEAADGDGGRRRSPVRLPNDANFCDDPLPQSSLRLRRCLVSLGRSVAAAARAARRSAPRRARAAGSGPTLPGPGQRGWIIR